MDINNELKLKIEIPEINPIIFEQNIIDGIPIIKKNIINKSAYNFWKEIEEKEIEEKENKDKKSKLFFNERHNVK